MVEHSPQILVSKEKATTCARGGGTFSLACKDVWKGSINWFLAAVLLLCFLFLFFFLVEIISQTPIPLLRPQSTVAQLAETTVDEHSLTSVWAHLHLWQNDQGLLCAAVVILGWNEYQSNSQHKMSAFEKKMSPAAPCWGSQPWPSCHESAALPWSCILQRIQSTQNCDWLERRDSSLKEFSPLKTVICWKGEIVPWRNSVH